MPRWMKASICLFPLITGAAVRCSPAAAAVTVVETSFDAETWIKNDEPIRIRVDHLPGPGEGRIAVFIGDTDLTSQFKQKDDALVYDPSRVKLPSGEQELVVQLVTDDGAWKEIGRFPIRVLTRAGFEHFDVDPRLDTNVWTRADAEDKGEIPPPDKTPQTASDYGVGLQTDFVRKGAEVQTSWNFLGVTLQEQALQYGNKGNDAARFDLSDYLITFRKGNAEFEVGHIVYGEQRNLLDQYYSRGIRFSYDYDDTFFFSAASMNGQSIVGYDNFAGLEDRDNNITAGSIGVQLIDKERISSRFDTTVLVGSLLPMSDFNVGEIPDKQKSRGIGFRLRTTALSERVRTDLSFARASFENPFNNDLGDGSFIRKSRRTTQNARYGEASVDLLRYHELWKGRTATLTATYRHEKIDPEYQTLGTFSDSDTLMNEASLDAEIAGVSGQFMHTWMEDNVDDVPTLLKTKTRDARFNVSVPVGQLWEGRWSGEWWWPTVTYSWNRVHQYGANVPRDAGFTAGSFGSPDPAVPSTLIVVTPGEIPDLVSTLQNVTVSFSGERWSADYSYAHSYENNRQPSQSHGDMLTVTHTVSGSVRPVDDLSITAGYERTRVKDEMTGINSYTRSYNLSFEYTFLDDWTILGNYTTTRDSEGTGGAKAQDINLETELARRFELPAPRGRKLPGRAYVRHLWQSTNRREPLLVGTDMSSLDRTPDGHLWILTCGMSISFF